MKRLSSNLWGVREAVLERDSVLFHPALTVSSPASAAQNPVLFFHQREIGRERLTSPLMGVVGQVHLYKLSITSQETLQSVQHTTPSDA